MSVTAGIHMCLARVYSQIAWMQTLNPVAALRVKAEVWLQSCQHIKNTQKWKFNAQPPVILTLLN